MENNNNNSNNSSTVFAYVVLIIMVIIAFASCGGPSSNSGRNWSDLSETEKENARYAYEVQKYINELD